MPSHTQDVLDVPILVRTDTKPTLNRFWAMFDVQAITDAAAGE